LISHDLPQISEFNYTSIEKFQEDMFKDDPLGNDICLDLFASPFNEDRASQDHVVVDMHFQNFDHSLDENYWRFLGDPIYDASSEESADF
jgi:hypothetical protein